MTWTPVLEGAAAERAFEIVRHLGAELSPEHFDDHASGLAFGPAGLALLLAYLARATADPALETRAFAILRGALAPREGGGDPGESGSLFSGFPGLTWLVEHLRDLTRDAARPLLEQADDAIVAALRADPWPGTFHYADGLVGLGVYLLERPASALSTEALARVVHHLRASAVADGTGWTWLRSAESFPVTVRPKTDVFDLGIPRGTTGVVAFLAAALERRIAPDVTEPLLRGAIDWLSRQQCDADPIGRFGDWLAPGAAPPPVTRLAWCYGDLGVSLALFAAARALGDARLKTTAMDLAILTTARDGPDTQIEDAGFCHGAAGAGHLYGRLYAATGEPRLLLAARRWFDATLAFYRPGEGSCGFSSYYPTNDDATFHSHSDPGLLMGASGIGLALLSASRPITPAWDRYFLVRIGDESL
jgi:hypothetical protein